MTAPLPSCLFGQTPDGRPARLYTLEDGQLRVGITDFGGRMVSIEAPDRDQHVDHILLGFDEVAPYTTIGGSFGALLGRFANRIAGANFEIDGQTFKLSKNSADATLHGGAVGFGKVFWTVAVADAEPVPRLVLRHVSPDGDQGFPGEVSVEAVYQLDAGSLSLSFEARTTKPTVINLSVHPYFNLGGTGSGDVLDHEVTIAAEGFLPTDGAQIPTGEIRPVAGTPFDFRRPTRLGARILHADAQLFLGQGYDHCFVLGTEIPAEPRLAVRVYDPVSGRRVELHTDQPGVQVYTGNKLSGMFAGHGGIIYRQSAGLALEPQDFPDAPHHANFPATILRPGTVYRRTIRYRFSAA